jgi:hypothetical protein
MRPVSEGLTEKVAVNPLECHRTSAENAGRVYHLPSLFMQVIYLKPLGGEGSRTPVLEAIVPNFYMRSRS